MGDAQEEKHQTAEAASDLTSVPAALCVCVIFLLSVCIKSCLNEVFYSKSKERIGKKVTGHQRTWMQVGSGSINWERCEGKKHH